MAAQWTSQVSESNARTLTEKLAEFSKTLSPEERDALTKAIGQSMAKTGDVQGYSTWDTTEWSTWWSWWNTTWEAEG